MIGPSRWLRKFLRRRMMPIPEDVAQKWKTRLSFAYMFVAWNAMGALAYVCYNGKLDWADYYGLKTEEEKNMRNNEYFARTIGRSSATTKLITVKGLTPVESRDFDFHSEVLLKEYSVPNAELSRAQRIEKRQAEFDRIENERLKLSEKANQDAD